MGTAVAWRRTGLVLVGVLALAGCGAFGPVPSVDEFRSNVSTVPGAQEIYFTVSGSTQGPNFSAFQDYTGTLAITGDGVVAATQDIESEFFFVGVPVTFNEPGTVETFATVTASDGSTAFKMVEIQVTAEVENRGSVSNPVRLSFGGPAKATKVGTGGARNSYYRFIPGVSSATIEITDQTISGPGRIRV